MKRSILYVFDEKADGRKLLDFIRGKSASVSILPITADSEAIERTEGLLKNGEWYAVKLNFVGKFHAKAFEVKDEFITFISDFSRTCKVNKKNLREYFKYPLGRFSIWWFSLLAEKSTMKSESYSTLVQLLAIQDFCRSATYQEICIDVNDTALTEAIRANQADLGAPCHFFSDIVRPSEIISIVKAAILALKYLIVAAGRSLFIRFLLSGHREAKRKFKKIRYLLVTYFPYLDYLKLKRGIFTNQYYEPLQNALKKHNPDSYAWLAMFVSRGKSNWRESVALGRKVNECGETLVFYEEWLTVLDIAIVLFLYFYLSLKYLLILPHLSQSFRFKKNNIKIWGIFRKDWNNSFCGYALIEGMLYYRVFRKVCAALDSDSIVTYFSEFLAWERALNIAFKKRPSIKVVGIQHAVIPLLLLTYFNDKKDLREADYFESMPKPDYLATTGDIPKKLFLESGWQKERLFSCGAIRFQRLKQCLNKDVSGEKRKDKVIVALSILQQESKELISFVYQEFKNVTGLEVIIKSHPFLQVKGLLDGLGIDSENSNLKFSELAIQQLLEDAKALIVRASSTSLDALACGCPVIIPKLSRCIDMNPLSGLSDFPVYVESSVELREKVKEIINQDFSFASSCNERQRSFISQYCNLSDSGEDLLLALDRLK